MKNNSTTTANNKPKLRIAIVHDWLYGGGAERVVHELHKLYPEAPIYTSYCSKEWRQRLDDKVITGYLQHWPFSKLRKFVPFLRIRWFEGLDLSGYDLVISSSGAEAKGIKVPKGTVHVNYCHAPTHYYWSRYDEYMKNPGFGALNWLARLGLLLLVRPLRKWDYKAAQRPHHMIANSTHIQAEIKKYYGRDSEVIFPPVALERFANSTETGLRNGFVIVGRQTPYKRVDLAVLACTRLKLPLMVLGSGPEHDRLTSMAGSCVRFRQNASDEEIVGYLQRANGYIFPMLDDFGIVGAEALAAGTPIIAYKAGGPLDFVEDGKTGIFFEEQSLDALCEALQSFNPSSFNHTYIKKTAERFSVQAFRHDMVSIVAKVTHQ